MPLLEAAGLAKSRGGRPVVASASLALKRGEILCLTGPSGSGKTTLLEMLAGILPPDRGTIRQATPPALMFQDDALIPWLSALANITYILPRDLPPSGAAATAAQWLERFGLEKDLLPAALSGGMRRRLSLARTFASGRELLLLDEPFAFLDDAWQEKVAAEITARASAGCAVLLATHSARPLARAARTLAISASPVVLSG
ncbi:MAG: ATP-binding cassette domain-containing protein [Desulfovibrio sp.]|jgi:ABC-type nitrate/sulfonate/bicarbonate transport system ATPase subunit|nr:ATP-binding cassette domain-containing protein [Desulfovibrio sp.]